jgi:hypothetical protein
VVVIPHTNVGEILRRLQEQAAAESDYTAAVARGDFSNDWVDTILDAHGVVAETALDRV